MSADGGRILYVKVTLDSEVMMPAVRAHMVFAALNAHGEMIGSVPTPDGIENFEGHEIEAWIVSEHEELELAKSATRVSDGSRSLAFRLRFCSLDHTLTDDEVGVLRARCIEAAVAQLGAVLR